MCRARSVSLLLLSVTIQQACQRNEATAPQPQQGDTTHSRAPADVAFTTQPPEGVLANAIISPAIQVTVKDVSGDIVAGGAVTIALGSSASPSATLSGTLVARLLNGVATFGDLHLDQPGRGYTLVAKAGSASGTSRAFAIVGPPTQAAFVAEPPADVEAGVAITPAVRLAIQDALGSTVPGATHAVTLSLTANTSGATMVGTTTIQAVDGIATFGDLAVDRPGSGYTLGATTAALAGATSSPFAGHVTFAFVDGGASRSNAGESCGVSLRGAGYCWGSNVRGALGSGTFSYDYWPSPVPVAGGHNLVVLSVGGPGGGGSHACGVTTSGSAYCWGWGYFGQLGDGQESFGGRSAPVAVVGGLSFTTISAGGVHTCGVTTAGAAYCWGQDRSRQLGDGPGFRLQQDAPVPVLGGLGFATISAGSAHTCGVTTGGAVYCWGANQYGQLGIGTTTGPETCSTVACSTAPVAVSGGFTFTTISAGGALTEGSGVAHTCGVTTDGTAYCWGSNVYGQLGDGTTTPQATPTAVAGGLRFVAVNAGDSHTCALTTSGAAYCWGLNGAGQLGDGTTTQQAAPVPVTGGLSFTTIRPGGYHTCGVATGGGVYCWGSNVVGQLGNGTTTGSLTPAPVAGQVTNGTMVSSMTPAPRPQ
jgi:alpha-tubulin suppressor-like RCC1 family protein